MNTVETADDEIAQQKRQTSSITQDQERPDEKVTATKLDRG